jgi:UDP-glucose 4-epimerase|tara:strand:+ start:1803 stop:2702 length:900 start_codon:yes stop_codon:yes gene_type:complete
MKKRCLVTGHKGYIGSRLYSKLQELGHEVVGIDIKNGHDINSYQGLKESNDGKFHPIWTNFKPEYIFHMACIPRVGYSIENPVETMKNNVLAGSNVLNFARKVGAKRVIYSSSSSIVGNGVGPTSPYALQKLTTEIETRLYSELYDIDTVSLRYFNVYSEDQPADGPYATAISNWMKYISQNKTPFVTGDGEQRRDMVHVDDVISANIFAMEHDKKFNGEVFDVGTGKNVSLNETAAIIHKYFPKVKFERRPDRAGEVLITKADIKGLKKLGWCATIDITSGINACFKKLKGKQHVKTI